MTINGSGVIAWTPTNAQVGLNTVHIRVTDAAGSIDTQRFQISVANSNDAPDITSTALTTAKAGIRYAYQVVAHDVDQGDVIRYSVSGPTGMTIDRDTGLVDWTPIGVSGNFSIVVTAKDLTNLTDTQSYTLNVAADTIAPTVTLSMSANAVNSGGPITFQVTGRDNIGTPTLALEIDSTPVTLGANGRVTINPTMSGIHSVEATATDAASNVATVTRAFTVRDPSDVTSPTVELTAPIDDEIITEPIAIEGTATDTNLVEVQLSIREGIEGAFTPIKTSVSGVSGGELGIFDPTLLENGLYQLRLEATDVNGQTSATTVNVQVQGGMKIGVFTLSFVDLQIPVSGIPITVTRTYDSRVKEQRDFGIGWSLDVAAGRFHHNRRPGEGWTLVDPPGVFTLPCSQTDELTNHRTEVRLSDREWYSFAATVLDAAPTVGGCAAQMGFTQIGGSGAEATLEVLGNNYVFQEASGDELFDDETFSVWNPSQVLLTTDDGRIIELERGLGITAIEDLNGNRIEIGSGGISSSTGKSITFTRDPEGRIVEIEDPLSQTISYQYDAAGDLARVIDQAGNATDFFYDDRHNLEDIVNPLGVRASRSEYDADGRLISVIDADGNRVELEHDLENRLELTRDRLGHVSTFEYDVRGNVVSKTDALSNEWVYTYDSEDNELTMTDPLLRTVVRTYDAKNRVLTVTDEEGDTTELTRDARGQVTHSEDARGREIETTYDANGNMTERVDGEGGTVLYTYSAAGNMLTMTDAIGAVTTFTYDSTGNQLTVTDDLGRVTTNTFDALNRRITSSRTRTLPNTTTETLVWGYGYDALGKPTTTTDPLGNITDVEYDALGKPSSVIAKNGNVTRYESDGLGRLSRFVYSDGTSDSYVYDAEGRTLEETNREGETATHEYDALGRRTKTIHSDGTYTQTTFDEIGRVLTQRDENGNVTTHGYDEHEETITDALTNLMTKTLDSDGQPTAVTDALSRTVEFTYDLGSVQHGEGRLVRVDYPNSAYTTIAYDDAGRKTAETDQAGRTTTFTYDDLGRLTAVTDALSHTWAYGYDEVGNRISITDPKSHVTAFQFDKLGRMTRRTLPLGEYETYAYDSMGNLTSKTDFNGDTTTQVFDAQSRLTSRTYPGMAAQTFTYSTTGRRLTAGAERFSYDDRGRLMTNTKPNGDVLSYSYDGVGNRTAIDGPQGLTSYAFDELNRLETVTDFQSGVTTYGYDDVGNLTTVALPNGNTTTRTYNNVYHLTNITTRNSATTVLAGYAYTPATTGRQGQVVESHSGRTVVYGYDAVYRLTSEAITDATNGNRSIGYTYDNAGNRATRTDSVGGNATYSYDNDDRLLTEVIGSNTTTFDYDDNGNMIEKAAPGATTAYVYDPRNLMVEAAVAGVEHGYEYDVDGSRIAHTIDGDIAQAFLVDNNREHAQVLLETGPIGEELARHTYGIDEVLSSVRSGTARYMHYDAQRSVRQLSNAAGAIAESYHFAAFGEPIVSAASDNAYRYSGERLDDETDLVHLRARQHDPRIGRFRSIDPFLGIDQVPSTLHRYAYASSDGVNRSDPSGLFDLGSAMISISIAAVLTAMPSPTFGHNGLTATQDVQARTSRAWARFYSIGLAGAGGKTAFGNWWLEGQEKDVAAGWNAIAATLVNYSGYELSDYFKTNSGAECSLGGGAFATLGTLQEKSVALCPDFFTEPTGDLPTGDIWTSQAGIWVHEVTHMPGVILPGGTVDHTEDVDDTQSRLAWQRWLLSAPKPPSTDLYRDQTWRFYNAYIWEAQFHDFVGGLYGSH